MEEKHMLKEDIDKLNIQLVETSACGMVLDITYDGKPIKRVEV